VRDNFWEDVVINVNEVVNKLALKCVLKTLSNSGEVNSHKPGHEHVLSAWTKYEIGIVKANLQRIVKVLGIFSDNAFIEQFLMVGLNNLDKFEVHLSVKKKGDSHAPLYNDLESCGSYGNKIVCLGLFEVADDDDIRLEAATLIHEFTHLALDVAYVNDCRPYRSESKNKRQEYKDIFNTVIKIYKKDPAKGEFYSVYDNYEKDDHECEVIARIPQLLVESRLNDGYKQLLKLAKDVPTLLSFWNKLGTDVSSKLLNHNYTSSTTSYCTGYGDEDHVTLSSYSASVGAPSDSSRNTPPKHKPR